MLFSFETLELGEVLFRGKRRGRDEISDQELPY